MEVGMMENGYKIRCMEKEGINGLMGANIQVTMSTTRNKVLEHTFGLMVRNISVIGKMEYNMVRVHISTQTECLEKDYGIMVKEQNGQEKQ